MDRQLTERQIKFDQLLQLFNKQKDCIVVINKLGTILFLNDNAKKMFHVKGSVFCKIKMQRIAMKNTECCHPIFLLFSRQRIG